MIHFTHTSYYRTKDDICFSFSSISLPQQPIGAKWFSHYWLIINRQFSKYTVFHSITARLRRHLHICKCSIKTLRVRLTVTTIAIFLFEQREHNIYYHIWSRIHWNFEHFSFFLFFIVFTFSVMETIFTETIWNLIEHIMV